MARIDTKYTISIHAFPIHIFAIGVTQELFQRSKETQGLRWHSYWPAITYIIAVARKIKISKYLDVVEDFRFESTLDLEFIHSLVHTCFHSFLDYLG